MKGASRLERVERDRRSRRQSDVARRQRGATRRTRPISFIIAAYGSYYRQSIAKQGFESRTDAIHDAWADGDREAAVSAVLDEMVDGLVAAGRPDAVRETVTRFEAVDGVDAVRVGFLILPDVTT